LRCVGIDLYRFPLRLEFGLNSDGRLKLVDWHLLLFFAALFIVVDGLRFLGLRALWNFRHRLS
jgi:hypothetical protein